MAGVTVKMGVTGLSTFKQSMKDAQAAVKTLDEELKLNEEQLKLNGNKELYMANQAQLLNAKLEAQKNVVAKTEAALKAMKEQGVDESSAAFQTMKTKLYSATTEMTKTKTEIKNLGENAETASGNADTMNESLKGIGKGVSWENVTTGLKDITEQLTTAARSAVNLGRKIYSSVSGSAEWADDVLTRATKYGVDAETIQRMDNVADIIDTDVDTIMKAKNRISRNQDDLGTLLGLDDVSGMSLEDQFWAAGDAILAMTDDVKQAEAAQSVFGANWQDLLPLFTAGRDAYQEALEGTNVLTNEQVQTLGEADDTIKQLEQEVQLLKNQFWSDNAETITSMMQWLIDNKDGVVAALGAIAVGFAGLKLAETATNIAKVVTGMQKLGLVSGGNGTTGGTPTSGTNVPTTTGNSTAGGKFWNGILDNMVNGAAVASLWGQYEYLQNKFNEEFGGLSLEEAQKKLTMQGFGLKTDEEYEDFVQLRDSGGTWGGTSFGNEEEQGLLGWLESTVAEGLDKMNETQEQTSEAATKTAENGLTSSDVNAFQSVPDAMADAVRSGVSSIKVILDGETVGYLVAPYVSQSIARGIN